MAKKLHIDDQADFQPILIGIASDERIWKLCHELNQGLQLRLVRQEKGEDIAPEPAKNQAETLSIFPTNELTPAWLTPVHYEDLHSHSRREYILREVRDRRRLPREARPFRFFLLIRPGEGLTIDTASLLHKLHQVKAIRSAVQLTHINPLNFLLH